MQVLGLLIAITIGIFMGRDAASRGMSGWFWGIIITCMMIVMLPIYLIVRKPRIAK